MKRFISVLFIILTTVLAFASCNKADEFAPTAPAEPTQAPVVYEGETKIPNDFAKQLPDFKFSSEITVTPNYDESLEYVFSVASNETEFKAYVEALKKAGFVNGYPEQAPVSDDGYYKASNAEKYMIEVTFFGGELTATVTRP